ncbi:MAG TPA: hypothetical protein VE954_39165 [Oligoflexus sp.]|uniref:hypothetical protein n=1 Tax=Oligoflexus sp. TaxID=1971216 RepID=UPI002D4CCAEC|nr:hypothetical protein [Oligoflexus sp.]HYX39163.1 hypothetical protein [Oligoflexus sp.]
MKSISLISILGISTAAAAGGTGGINPPAREKLLEELVQAQPGSGGLFDAGNGNLGLGIKHALNPELILSRYNPMSGIPLTDIDFSALNARKGNIHVESISASNTLNSTSGVPSTLHASYRIEDGNTADTLLLKDRRVLMRNSVNEESAVKTPEAAKK